MTHAAAITAGGGRPGTPGRRGCASAVPNAIESAVARFRYRCAGCSQVKPIPPCSRTHSCAACTATFQQYAVASHRDGASGHVVGQAPGSQAGRHVHAAGDAAKSGLKPVLRGRGHAEAAQGLPGLVLLDPGLLPAGHLAGQLDKPGSLAARQVVAPRWRVRHGHPLLVRAVLPAGLAVAHLDGDAALIGQAEAGAARLARGDAPQRDAEELAVGALVVLGELMVGSFGAGLAGACRGLVLHSPSRRVAALGDEQLLAQNIPFCAATGGESSWRRIRLNQADIVRRVAGGPATERDVAPYAQAGPVACAVLLRLRASLPVRAIDVRRRQSPARGAVRPR